MDQEAVDFCQALIDNNENAVREALHSSSIARFINNFIHKERLQQYKLFGGFDNRTMMTPLFFAIMHSSIAIVTEVIEYGASLRDLTDFKDTAMHLACDCPLESVAKCKYIISKDKSALKCVNSTGNQPLNIVAIVGNYEVMQLLIANGADIHFRGEYGSTPLVQTAKKGNIQCLKTLIQNGAQINSTDDNNSTALTLAADFGHMACVEALLEHETVDIHARKKDPKTKQSTYASMKGHNDILDYINRKRSRCLC